MTLKKVRTKEQFLLFDLFQHLIRSRAVTNLIFPRKDQHSLIRAPSNVNTMKFFLITSATLRNSEGEGGGATSPLLPPP